MTDDAAFSRKEPHLGKCGNAAEAPEKPHLASPPYRGEAMRHGDAGENEAKTPVGQPPLRAREEAPEKAPRKRAAPVTRSDEVVERILAAVSEGVPLAKVLREDWAPHHSSFYDWLNNDAELDERFERARQAGHDLISVNIRDVTRGGEGSSGDVKRDRLIAEYDLKLLEKWDRRYSQRQVIAGDPDAPLVIDHRVSGTDIERELIDILSRAAARRAHQLREGYPLDDISQATGRLAEVSAAISVIEGVGVDGSDRSRDGSDLA